MKKYIAVGGHVTSRNDGQDHYISPSQVCRCYKVPPSECVFMNHADDFMAVAGLDTSEMIWLHPDPTGEYLLAEEMS